MRFKKTIDATQIKREKNDNYSNNFLKDCANYLFKFNELLFATNTDPQCYKVIKIRTFE